MKVEVLDDAEAAARSAADFIAGQARRAIVERGRFLVAFSGGSTPRQMLDELASHDVSWPRVHVVQVDERIVPPDDPDRNLALLRESLLSRTALPPEQLHAMPVESEDLAGAAASYSRRLDSIAGSPVVLDLVHLGLGSDGHTASLVPGDPVLEVDDRDVAVTGFYQGHRRMTLTFPALNRARTVLWLVTGSSKAEMLRRLGRGDPAIPAGRVQREHATILADRKAGESSGPSNLPGSRIPLSGV